MVFASPGSIRQRAADTRSSQWAAQSLRRRRRGCEATCRVGVNKQRRTTTLQQEIDTPSHRKQPTCKTAYAGCTALSSLAEGPSGGVGLSPCPRQDAAHSSDTTQASQPQSAIAAAPSRHTRGAAQPTDKYLVREYDLPYSPCISRDRAACLPRTHAWRHRRIPRSVVCVGRMEWTDNARQQHESVTGQRVHTRADNNYSVLGEATRTRNGAFLRRQENPQPVEPWIGWIDGSDGGMDSRAARAL